MLTEDKIKVVAVVLTIIGALTTMGINYAVTNEKLAEIKRDYNGLLLDLKQNREDIAFLDSQSLSKIETDKYQNKEHERIYSHIEKINDVIFELKATKTKSLKEF